jgi:hypothetical protein
MATGILPAAKAQTRGKGKRIGAAMAVVEVKGRLQNK